MLNKKTIFIAAAGVAASVLLFKGIRKAAGAVKEKLASVSSEEDLEDLADTQEDTREDGCYMEACGGHVNGMRLEKKACDCEATDCCETVCGECES